MDPESPNILHTVSRKASWSRANEKGVFPGIATPLNWSIWEWLRRFRGQCPTPLSLSGAASC